MVILTSSLVFANPLVFEGVKEQVFTQNGLQYILQAKKKTIDYKKLGKIRLFNSKNIVSQLLYYNQGVFHQKNLKISFEKAYFYEGNLYMQECYTQLEDGYIKAKTAIYRTKYIEYKDVSMEQSKKKYHKFKYILNL